MWNVSIWNRNHLPTRLSLRREKYKSEGLSPIDKKDKKDLYLWMTVSCHRHEWLGEIGRDANCLRHSPSGPPSGIDRRENVSPFLFVIFSNDIIETRTQIQIWKMVFFRCLFLDFLQDNLHDTFERRIRCTVRENLWIGMFSWKQKLSSRRRHREDFVHRSDWLICHLQDTFRRKKRKWECSELL